MSIPVVLYLIYGYAIPVVILAVLYGFRWKAGMWGNCISLGTVLFSFLIAVGWWEDVAELLAQQAPITLFVADCVAFWIIFIVALLILDTATRFMSTVRIKYADVIENVGNGIVLFLLFLTLYGIFLFAEDLGPVGEKLVADSPGDSVAIKILRILSVGNLSAFSENNVKQFDGEGEFQSLHQQRRQAIMYNQLNGDSIKGSADLVGKLKRKE